jgi:hypothetical protein
MKVQVRDERGFVLYEFSEKNVLTPPAYETNAVARALAEALVFLTGPVPIASDRSIAEAKSTWEPAAVVAEADVAEIQLLAPSRGEQKVVIFPTGKPKA